MIKKLISDKTYFSIALIVIFHLVGFIGFANEIFASTFEKLVPFHLLLMLAIVLWNNESWNKSFAVFAISVYTLSFLIEMIGTNTGLIFGEYYYGETLGVKLLETPLLIGVNWFLLVYGVGVSLNLIRKLNLWLSAAFGATILSILDYFIEPVAIKFDYWQWANQYIPTQNYVAWWVLAFVFMLMFNKLHFNKRNIPASILLLVQFIFFILLNYYDYFWKK